MLKISKFSNMIEKFIKMSLPIFFFVLALAFYLKTYDSCMIKITLVQMGGVFFIALWMMKMIEQRNFYSRFKNVQLVLLPVLLFLLSGIISYFISPFEVTSLEELTRRLIYVGIFFIIVFEFDQKKDIERLLRFLIGAGFIASLYGLIQFLGLDPFLWKGAFGNRIFSTFGNPNFFSAYLVWCAPLLLVYMLATRKFSYFIIFMLLAFNVMQTKSKASWIGFTASVVMFSILSVNFLSHAQKKKIKKIIIGFLILTVLGSGLGVYYFITKRVNSVRFRVFTWEATWKMIRVPKFVSPLQSQILGTGIGTFKIVYPSYRPPEIFHIEGKHNTETDHPENEFLEVWYDEGIVGIGIFLWLLFMMYYFGIYRVKYLSLSSKHTFRRDMTKYQTNQLYLQHYMIGVISGTAGLLVHNLMCVNMRFVSSGIYLWVLLAMLVALVQSSYNLELDMKTREMVIPPPMKVTEKIVRRTAIGIIIALGLYFMFFFSRFFVADIYHNRGIAFSKVKRWQEGLTEYLKVLKNNPHYIMTHYFMGNVFNDRWNMEPYFDSVIDKEYGKPRTDAERALAKYNDVKKLAPNYVQVHHQVGVIYTKLGQWEKALESFIKYKEIDPVYPQNYFRLAYVYTRLERLDDAMQAYKDCIKNNPKFFEAYVNLGNVYYTQNNFEEAEKNYIKAIELNPRFIKTQKNLLALYVNTKQLNKAVLLAQNILKLDPNDKQVIDFLSRVRQQ